MMPGQQNTKTPASQQFGQAQPQQPQPQGTPYNPQQGGNFSAYSPQQPNLSGYRPQQAAPQQGGGFSAWDPNIANNAQAPRPPAFQAAYGQMGGGYSDRPDTPKRDAFISQVNNQLGQMQGQSWQQPTGAPQFNFGQMMGQANQMAEQGFQNPFAMQPPPQDNAAAVRGLLQGFNIPQNVMEQISGMFGGQQQPAQPVQGPPGQAQPGYGTPTAKPKQVFNPSTGAYVDPPLRRLPPSKSNTSSAADKFLAGNQDAIKYGAYKPSDIDKLGLPYKEAQALKKQAQQIQNRWDMTRKAQEMQFAFGGKGGGMKLSEYEKKMREFGASPAAAGLYSPLKK